MSLREDVEKIEDKVEKTSVAMEMLKFSKEQNNQLEANNKRMFKVLIVVLVFWFLTIGYLVYVLNDMGTTTETTTQEVTQDNSNGNNNFIGNDGDIINGEAKN